MAIREKAITDVEINGQNASTVLDQLKTKADGYRKAMVEANKANDLTSYKKAEAELKKTERTMGQLKKATFDVNQVMRNLSSTSANDLTRAQRQIQAELKKTTRGTAEYIAKSKQLQQVSTELRRVRTEMTGVAGAQGSFFGKMANGFNKYGGMALGLVASLTGLGLTFRKLANDAEEYQQKVANLSALTGLVGDDLDWLSKKAKELSTSTTEDGIRITKSADEIVDAFTVMGSKKPELLENKEALAAVTTEALKLSEAAQMDTKTAVESLANVMNQFGAEADQASKFINVLAAGSKFGAAAVDKIAESVIRFGPAAASANISVEESVALIETLAEKGVDGQRAGTALRTALLKMQTGADEFNPKVVGLNQALENLKNANLSAGDMVKLFGQEAYTAGAILVENVDRVKHYTDAVTDTNVATEQAIKNTETEKALRQQAVNQFKLAALELGQRLAPALRHVTVTGGTLVKVLVGLVKWMDMYGKYLLVAVSGISAYVIAIKATTIAKQIYTRAANLAKIATEGFNSVMKKNPIGLFIAGLTTAISYLAIFRSKADDAAKSVKELTDAQKIFNELMSSTKSIEERMAIIGTLSKRQAEVLKDDIETQLKLEEDYTSKLLTELKARLDGDSQLNDLKKQLENEELDFRKAGIQNRINIRKNELAEELQLQHNNQKQRIASLKGYLNQVSDLKFKDEDPGEVKKGYDELQKALEEHTAQLRLTTQRSYLQGEIDKEERDKRMHALEVAHLEGLLALQKQYGELTYDTEYKLTLERIKLLEQFRAEQYKISDQLIAKNQADTDAAILAEFDAYEKEVDAKRKAVEEKKRLDAEELQSYIQKTEQHKQITDQLASSVGALLGQMATDAEMNSEEVARQLLLIALDSTHAVVRMAIAQIWAQSLASPTSVATWGAAGVAKALVISALVEGAFAGVKAMVMNVGQRYAGKYDVIGQDDGRTYRQVPYKGDMKTGIYSQPTLVGERGSELVVDAGTLRNVSVNFPDVLPKIRASMVPQRAAGNVAERTNQSISQSANQPINQSADPELKALLYTLTNVLKNGIQADVSYQRFKDQVSKAERIESDTSRNP